MRYLAVIAAAYLLGSIPFGFLAGQLAGIDIRERGSKNIGATNVVRVLGKKFGYPVFLADVLKGYAAAFLPCLFLERTSASYFPLAIAAGFAAVVGHSFPIWLKFRGGKGVATAGGACFALAVLPTLIAIIVWVSVFFTFRYVSLASLIAAGALPLSLWLLSFYSGVANYWLLGFTTVLALLIILRHRENIGRLLRGTEPRFNRK